GFDALAKISDHQPRVIFVDIMMPRLDGYQTCALIKQHPKLKSTPVIMLSSKDGVFDRARGRLAGSARCLTKPITKEGLIHGGRGAGSAGALPKPLTKEGLIQAVQKTIQLPPLASVKVTP